MSETYILWKRFRFDASEDDHHKVVRFTPDRNKGTVVLEHWQTKTLSQTRRTSSPEWLFLRGIHSDVHGSDMIDLRIDAGVPLTVRIPFGRAVWEYLVENGWTMPNAHNPSCYLPPP